VSIAAAYPGTPSTEVIQTLARMEGVYTQWSPNEKVALEFAFGACFGGSRAMAMMKHVGLNVAADPFFTISYTGVNAGLVVVVADDPEMHSSQNEQDSRHYARAAKVPCLEPTDSQEAHDLVPMAFEMSEEFDCQVMLRSTTRISHGKAMVVVGERKARKKPLARNPQKYVMVPANARRRHVNVETRMEKLAIRSDELSRVERGDDSIGIISNGVGYQYAREAFPGASHLKLAMTNPLPKARIAELAEAVKTLYVVEEGDPFVEEQVRALGYEPDGKARLPLTGEYNVEILREKLLGTAPPVKPADLPLLPMRPPTMCAGCPHRGLFHVLRKLKVVVSGDIGCYTLGVLPPLSAMDTCICMGASVSASGGMARAAGPDEPPVVAVIGDSTFVHSGITGLVDMVYNRSASTVIIMDNRTTAMTGGQDHPATGRTLMGDDTHALDLEELSRAIGVECVVEVDPYDLDGTEAGVKAALEHDGPSVVLSRRPCVVVYRPRDVVPYASDPEKCTACGACLRLGCPAMAWEGEGESRHSKVEPALCVGCGVCAQVCKFDALREVGP